MPLTHPYSLAIFIAAALLTVVSAAALRRAASERPDLSSTASLLAIGMFAWAALGIAGSTLSFFPSRTEFTEADLPGFLILNGLISLFPAIFVVAAVSSSRVMQVVSRVPTWVLVGVHVYRLGGLVILLLGLDGRLTPFVGYAAGVGDVTVGLTAAPIAYLLYTRRPWARIVAGLWAAFGLLEFSVAVIAVQLSFFELVQFDLEPAMVGFAPMATIVVFQLPFGILTHILLLMRLGRDDVP
ncbi:MAG: hypothetical protein AAF602_00210 [Myxococcota bacterium]